ncbi:MAG: aryl-sulfate sulfotransferase [Chloroflexota bacterium]|nr:aryl-sulfate sulfotransferase [Chloroflexota bacterium]
MKVTYKLATSIIFAMLWVLSSCSSGSDEVNTEPAGFDPDKVAKSQNITPSIENQSEVAGSKILNIDSRGDGSNALNFEIRVELNGPAKVYVEYGNSEVGLFRTVTTDLVVRDHIVPLVRLRPSTLYEYEVFIVNAKAGIVSTAAGSFRTSALPSALSTIEHSIEGTATHELLLLDHEDVSGSYIYALDNEGEIVWYYESPNLVPDQAYAINAIRQRDNYNLVYYMGRNRRPCCIREITPFGDVIDNLSYSEIDGLPHHDHLILPDHQIMYLARIYKQIDDQEDVDTLVEGDSIRIWDQKSGMTREVWNSFDTFSPEQRLTWETVPFYGVPGKPVRDGKFQRWWNANSIDVGSRGNYILSVKTHNQVVSLSPDLQHVEWVFGGPNGIFNFQKPEDQFYLPHTATELPNGNILIFDNGKGRPEDEGGEYTRVIEFALNEYDLAPIKVWEYRPNPDLFSRTRGGAYRLDNGNTLVNFNTTPRVVVEVGVNGEEVWRMSTWSPSYKGSYRAYAINSIWGEVKIK